MSNNILHINTRVAFIVHAVPIINDKNLRRFMIYPKFCSYFIRNISMVDDIQKIKINTVGRWASFEAVPCHAAYAAPAAVLKNYLGGFRRICFQFFKLLLIQQRYPVHRRHINFYQ